RRWRRGACSGRLGGSARSPDLSRRYPPMRFLTLALLALAAPPAAAADLGKIDRTIKKEPAYKNKPYYGLLVFGPEAKGRVWVVLDGDTLYVDRNGDGDLPAADARHADRGRGAKSFTVAGTDGVDRYSVSGFSLHQLRGEQAKHGEWLFSANVNVGGKYSQYCGILLKNSAREAPVAPFGGPLRVCLQEKDGTPVDKLVTGDKPGQLYAMIGTIDEAHGCWVVVCNSTPKDFPAGLHPVA